MIGTDLASVELSLVPWDSETFGFPVAQIDGMNVTAGASTAILRDAFETWCTDHDVRLVSARLDHGRLRESMALEAMGFRFVETVYRPRFTAFDVVGAPRHAIEVSTPAAADLDAIEAIAASAFDTGRFLLDGRLDPALSHRRYARWVRRSLDGDDQQVLKAEMDGALVGFFIVESRADATVYWHLTAIAPGWQGQGIGLSLWQTMLIRHRTEGATSVETTISGHNLAAINLYARLGFSFASAQMTFHWVPEPVPAA